MAKEKKPNNPENAPANNNPFNPPEIQDTGKTPEIPNNPPAAPAPAGIELPAAVPTEPAPAKGNVDNATVATVPQIAGNLIELMDTPPGEIPPLSTVLTPPPPVNPPLGPDTAAENPPVDVPRGRGRPPGSKNKPKSPSTVADIAAPPPTVPIPNYAIMGELVFDMSTNALAMGLGPEWLPQSPEERQLVAGSLGKYFEAQQVKDIPPGMMLALVVTVYGLPRLSKPSTASKLKLAWLWIKSKFGGRKNPFKVVSDEKEKV